MNEKIFADGKKAVIYLRVSTEEQVDNFSLDTQEEICRKEADKRGYEVIQIFREEGRSAKNILGRPTLINLIEYCRKNVNQVQAVFVYRLDRISRQTADYLAIRKKLGEKNVNIISATEPTGDSPTEKLVETILAGFAQLDNDIRSERAKNGLRARFLSGKLVSGYAPIGYTSQAGYVVKDPKTWDLVKKAWDLMETGSKSLSEMAKEMNLWGLRWYKQGKEYLIKPQTADKIFRNKFYMGVMASKTYKEEIQGQHVPMISEQQFYKVQAILDGRNVNQVALSTRVHSREDMPLRRIIRCSLCGLGLTGGWSKGRSKKYAYYRCSNKSCKLGSVKVDVLEETLINLLKQISPKKECIDLFTNYLYKNFYERVERLNKIKNSADEEIAKLKSLRKHLVEKNLSGVFSDEIFKEQSDVIEDQLTKQAIVKEESTIDKYNVDSVISFLKTKLADLGETYKKSNISQAKVLIGSIFASELSWDINGTLNHKISPLFQAIRMIDKMPIPSCADERS
ncbi:MAG TPA: recombinase family protein [Candidatus Sulfotelmatobacter sp.]|nr:recombinase family protein [Candidatus Sulfotelmatobacter sp.]